MASTYEHIKLAITDAMLSSADYTTIESADKLNEALVKQGVTGANVEGNATNGYVVTVDKEKYKVYSNGTVKTKLIVTEIVAENYGDVITRYTANGVSNWKVFYNDGNNVWIIASDYVAIDTLDIDEEQSTATKSGMSANGYKACWSSAPSGDGYSNVKCATTLSNTENWTNYVDTKLVTKAMGGATIEMFAKSYNAKYPSKTIEYTNIDTDYNGYKVK